MEPWSQSFGGRFEEHELRSDALHGNPLGDPHVRKLGVWLPPQYAEGRRQRFPVLYDLVGFTGSGLAHTNWKPFGENVPERAARLIREQKMGPAIIVFPDCFTAFGGNQYVNSSAIGRYADYLTRELIPYVDRGNVLATRPSERKTAVVLFTLFCILGLTLTFVGIFFRGPGYSFAIPYVTTAGFHFSL